MLEKQPNPERGTMMKPSRLLPCLMLTPVLLLAQPAEPPRHFAMEGVVELGGSVGFQATRQVVNGTTSDPVYALSASPFAGYFVLNELELVANPLGVAWTKNGGNTTTDLRFLAGPSYNFRTGTIVYPFVEGLAGMTVRVLGTESTSTTLSGFSWGGRGGVKIGLPGRGLLVLGAQYLVITLDPSGAPNRNGQDELSVVAGFNIWM